MKQTSFLILYFVICSTNASSQNWFPLEIGNKWMAVRNYEYMSSIEKDFYFLDTKEDTLITGQRFFRVVYYSQGFFSNTHQNLWLRYSQIDQKIYLRGDDTTVVYMDFNVPSGQQFEYYDPFTGQTEFRTVFESSKNHFGQLRNTKGFQIGFQLKMNEWISDVGFNPFGNLRQVIQINNSDTIYYEYGAAPDFSSFHPVLQTENPEFEFKFIILHPYTNFMGAHPSNFLEYIRFNCFYISNTDTILSDPLTASFNPPYGYKMNFIIEQSMLNNGYEFHYNIDVKDKGLIPKYRTKPDSGFYKLKLISTKVENTDEIIDKFSLFQNYPNPFNPVTKIKYSIPNVETGLAPSLQVTLKVYDVLGREVATLINEEKQPGVYEVEFNPVSGIQNLASGVYYYQLKAGNFVETKKMILLQ